MKPLTGACLLFCVGCGGVSANLPKTPVVQSEWEYRPGVQGQRAADFAWWTLFHDPVLDRLVELADAQNLDLRIADARIREARALRSGAGAALLPQVTGSVGGSMTQNLQGGESTPSVNAAIGASWEVDVFGRLRHTFNAEDAAWHASIADADAVRLTLIAEAVRTYVEYRLYQAQRDISARNAQAAEETLRIGRLRLEQGLGSRLEVERPLAALATTRAQVATAVELAESARYRLVLLLATTPEELAKVLPSSGPVPHMDPVAVLLNPTDVIMRRPDVRAAGYDVLAAVARRDAAAALRWPRISLASAIGLNGVNVANMIAGGPILSLGANLLAPLLNFGLIRSTIDAADARQEQAYLAYERVARSAVSEVQTAIILYTQGVIRRSELEVAIASARKAGEIARRQYAEGTISLVEVLDAERELRDNELNWSQATAEVSLRVVRLYQTMGIVPPRKPAS